MENACELSRNLNRNTTIVVIHVIYIVLSFVTIIVLISICFCKNGKRLWNIVGFNFKGCLFTGLCLYSVETLTNMFLFSHFTVST